LVAVPEPEVQWYFNGQLLKESADITISGQADVHMYSYTVNIKKVSQSHAGVFEIIAKNREGEASTAITLAVEVSMNLHWTVLGFFFLSKMKAQGVEVVHWCSSCFGKDVILGHGSSKDPHKRSIKTSKFSLLMIPEYNTSDLVNKDAAACDENVNSSGKRAVTEWYCPSCRQ
jgi:hypothetical protein